MNRYVPDPKYLAALLLASVLSTPCMAMPDDRNQTASLTADKVDLNQGTHQGEYTGNMQFDQGTSHLRAHKAMTRVNQQNKLIYAVAWGEKGNPVHYWEQPAKDKPELHAYADEMRYYPEKHLIKLLGNARISQGKDSFTAPIILYNTQKKHMIAESNKKARTQIILHPVKKHE